MMEKDMKQMLEELTTQIENARYWIGKMGWETASLDDEALDILTDIREMMDTIRFRKIKRLEKKLG